MFRRAARKAEPQLKALTAEQLKELDEHLKWHISIIQQLSLSAEDKDSSKSLANQILRDEAMLFIKQWDRLPHS